jgi:hypothetical protein
MRQHPETTERDARCCFGVGIHRFIIAGRLRRLRDSSEQAGARAAGLSNGRKGATPVEQRSGAISRLGPPITAVRARGTAISLLSKI